MRRQLTDYRLFFKEFRRSFHTTGALLPSSPPLCRALARYVGVEEPGADNGADVATETGGQRILEVGPGTGAVTRWIARRMRPADKLYLVEINQEFAERLERLLEDDPKLSVIADRARVIHANVQDVSREEPYDRIISGLPLNNFAAGDVEQILETFRGLLAPRGTLSFFEYIAVRPMRGAVAGRAEKERLRAIGQLLGDVFREHEFHRQAIWINVPPAWVHHVRFDTT